MIFSATSYNLIFLVIKGFVSIPAAIDWNDTRKGCVPIVFDGRMTRKANLIIEMQDLDILKNYKL